ncbi:polysaccharide deacetylase family protein [Bacillus sp. 2205SS5-2]|uniref:polysaccharide deacetylase family protein n=1 Tax=Bacillus sp. 2205SS5-2 TaxID=3109031 RepID=UPI0030079901
MKLFLNMCCLSLILIVASCSNEEAGTKKTESDVNVEQETEKDIEENTIEQETISEPEESVEEVISTPQYRLNSNDWSIEPISEANDKIVLLTIDDAPDQHALQMAKTLKELNAPAIFFVNGHFLDTPEEKQVLKEIYDMGFPIGNHTYSHSNLRDLSEEKQKEEIISINNMVEEITGERPRFFRAPFGVNTDYSKTVVSEENMLLMNWTYGYDWEKEYQNKEGIADIMVNTPLLRNGANLLMHDRTWTNEALAEIVEGLRGKGYEMLDPNLIETPVTDPA